MTYNLDKTSTSLFGFKLDDSQKNVLEAIIHFISNKDKNDIIKVVSAKAGTGKTTINAVLIKILESNNIGTYVVTPTNKSKNVLGQYIRDPKKVMTIHSFLNLKPNLDIIEFDAKDMQFKIDFNVFHSEPYSVYIIDEGSMINNDLFDALISVAKRNDSKIIVFCDPKQLAPVKQKSVSKLLNRECLTLNTIHRQKEDCSVRNVLDILREKPIYKFKTTGSNFIVYDNIKTLLEEKAPIFKLAADLKDPTIIKIVAYTNKRIELLNNVVRKIIYNDNEEYHYGEILTGYDTCVCTGYCEIKNSADYIVYNCSPIFWRNFKAWVLELYHMDENKIKLALVLSKDNPQWMFDALAAEIEALRLDAVKSKNKRMWREYFKLSEMFFTPVDLIYEDRIIKRKSLDYGYSISAHRSQGSNYMGVIVDFENLKTCPDKEVLRQLEYVSISRTKGDVYIYQK